MDYFLSLPIDLLRYCHFHQSNNSQLTMYWQSHLRQPNYLISIKVAKILFKVTLSSALFILTSFMPRYLQACIASLYETGTFVEYRVLTSISLLQNFETSIKMVTKIYSKSIK